MALRLSVEKGVEKCKERCSGGYNLRTEHPKRTANEGTAPRTTTNRRTSNVMHLEMGNHPLLGRQNLEGGNRRQESPGR